MFSAVWRTWAAQARFKRSEGAETESPATIERSATAVVGTGLLLSAYPHNTQGQAAQEGKAHSYSEGDESAKGGEVTAVEDLMREHGVLRRALLVYTAVEVASLRPARGREREETRGESRA